MIFDTKIILRTGKSFIPFFLNPFTNERIFHFTILTSKIGVGEFPMTWVVDSSHGEITVVISFHHGSTMVKWISFHQGRRPEWLNGPEW